MRIARVLTRLNLGGPARQALASDTRLAQRGHQLRLFVGSSEPGEGDLFDEFRARGLDLVRVSGLVRPWRVAGDLRARAFLKRELARFAPQVVHTHASKAGALGRAAARGLAAARVHTFHGHVLEGYFPAGVSRGILAVERRLARETDRIVAVSHATAEDLLRLGVASEAKLTVVPPGIELEPFLAIERRGPSSSGPLRAQLGLAPEVFLVAVVGRLVRVKRPELALEVLQLLAGRYPGLHLCYVGDGEERALLQRRTAELETGLRARVHLLGARSDMPAVLSEVDALLSCSRSEGLPVALIEAAAAGLPVVATPVGGVEELVAHERTGFLGSTALELAFGLAQLLDDSGRGAALGARARLRVRTRHSAEALASRLEQLYRAVIEERACVS
jgi:glycosyltransferase involved in cell wall biosynthesis